MGDFNHHRLPLDPSSSSRSIVKALWAFGPLRFVTLRQPSQECKEAKCILEDPLFRCPRLFQCLPFASRERRELFYIVLFLWGTLLPVFIEPFLRILASSVLDLPVSQAISKRSRHLCEAISLSRYPFGKLESVGWSALALRAAAARAQWGWRQTLIRHFTLALLPGSYNFILQGAARTGSIFSCPECRDGHRLRLSLIHI